MRRGDVQPQYDDMILKILSGKLITFVIFKVNVASLHVVWFQRRPQVKTLYIIDYILNAYDVDGVFSVPATG